MLKTAHVQFQNEKYNYKTSVNGKCSDEEIKAYFIDKVFNLGGITYIDGKETETDNMQQCIKCDVIPQINKSDFKMLRLENGNYHVFYFENSKVLSDHELILDVFFTENPTTENLVKLKELILN